MTNPQDDRSAIAHAYAWASRIVSICLEMVVPGLVGLWIDRSLGTKVLFTFAGFGLGFTLGMIQLVRITRTLNSGEEGPDDRADEP